MNSKKERTYKIKLVGSRKNSLYRLQVALEEHIQYLQLTNINLIYLHTEIISILKFKLLVSIYLFVLIIYYSFSKSQFSDFLKMHISFL